MLMASWNMVQVTFTMNLYLRCLSHLTMSFLLSSEDIRPILFSKSRQLMATLIGCHTYPFLPIVRRQNHLIMGRTWYVILAFDTSDPMTHVALFVFHFIICFVKVLRWWGVTRFTQPHVHTYIRLAASKPSSRRFLAILTYIHELIEFYLYFPMV
jgi:hypothetical protein